MIKAIALIAPIICGNIEPLSNNSVEKNPISAPTNIEASILPNKTTAIYGSLS